MIYDRHNVTIEAAGFTLDLGEDDSLAIRLNTLLYDPTKISSRQSEYSFTFDLPMTPNNNKAFSNANILSKEGKFGKVYEAVVQADGNEVFKGNLRIAGISGGKYKCNLVSIKVDKVEDIFGDSMMNELAWYVPYEGVSTINSVNSDLSTDYFFPFVCYGAFQKKASKTYNNEYNAYTSKYLVDNTNLFYDESFSPSVRLNELVKRMFSSKGYEVSGDIFDDALANDVFLSTHLADGQHPTYNIGGNRGKVEVSYDMWNGKIDGRTAVSIQGLAQNLTYTYDYVGNDIYNFDQVDIFDVFNVAKNYSGTGFDNRLNLMYGQKLDASNNEMFQDGYIVIPADGAYKIELEGTIDITNNIRRENAVISNGTEDVNKVIEVDFADMPVELQLVRNGENVELIHGFDGKVYSVYPHEPPNTDALGTTGRREAVRERPSSTNSRPTRRESSGSRPSTRVPDPDSNGDIEIGDEYNMGYLPKQGELLAYDQLASANFICGLSTICNSPSVIKDGWSWNSSIDTQQQSRYVCNGYWGCEYKDGEYKMTQTTYNTNQLGGAPANTFSSPSSTKRVGKVSCIVWLKRNDMVSLKMVLRKYRAKEYVDERTGATRTYKVGYYGHVTGKVKVEAYSPNVADISSTSLNWSDSSKFDKDLNLAQFFNSSVKQADFINNYMKAFNLVFSQEGNSVALNKNRIDFGKMLVPVELDGRVNNRNITILPIDYPSSMGVNYKIDEEEAGFYNSVPKDKLNLSDWKDYAERGSEKVLMDAGAGNTEISEALTNSYTWYSQFRILMGTEEHREMLPIISKDEWMIENYKPEESMSHDGKSLPQRWWFRGMPRAYSLKTTDGKDVYPSIPTNTVAGHTLDYKAEDGSLLSNFFNITAYVSSNMVEFECYLTPREYVLLKKGAPVRIDSDIYIVCEVEGYDPSGKNSAKITAMKKA